MSTSEESTETYERTKESSDDSKSREVTNPELDALTRNVEAQFNIFQQMMDEQVKKGFEEMLKPSGKYVAIRWRWGRKSLQILGFRQTYDRFPREIYYTTTDEQEKRYKDRMLKDEDIAVGSGDSGDRVPSLEAST
ncbi:hypothetical protein CPC16_006796 [Podila verticillata]|nr:hypothetical protein CPC16_006796 [Podila verticillata]